MAIKGSSVSIWVKITSKTAKTSFATRTSQKVLKRYLAGKTKDAWKDKSGSLDDLDFIGYEDSSEKLVTRKSGVYAVELSKQGEVTVRCLADHPEFSSLPQTMCGDGLSAGLVLEIGAASLSEENYQATAQDYVNFAILNDDTVTQSKACKTLVNMFQSCDVKEKAVTRCDVILTDANRSQCLAESGEDPMDHFNDCLTSVCDGDESALETFHDYIRDNCEGVPPVEPQVEPPVVPLPVEPQVEPPVVSQFVEPATPAPEPETDVCIPSNGTDWRKSFCPCSAPHTACYSQLCYCAPGYYYSLSTQCCVKTCDKLSVGKTRSDAYTTYYYMNFDCGDGVIARTTNDDPGALRQCMESCAATEGCRAAAFDFASIRGNVVCTLCSLGPLDDGTSVEENSTELGFGFAQRTCAGFADMQTITITTLYCPLKYNVPIENVL